MSALSLPFLSCCAKSNNPNPLTCAICSRIWPRISPTNFDFFAKNYYTHVLYWVRPCFSAAPIDPRRRGQFSLRTSLVIVCGECERREFPWPWNLANCTAAAVASGGIRSRILSATLNVLFWIAIICAICCILSGDELPVITFPVCLILCQQFIVTCSHCLHIIFEQSGSFFHVVPFFLFCWYY